MPRKTVTNKTNLSRRQYFGTDGIRGKVGSDLINPNFMLKLSCAIGKVLLSNSATNNKVLIGRDTRKSGHMLEAALQSGLNSAGIDVRLLGPIPTPALAYLTQSLRASAGIVISASHNPFDDNGIKLFDSNGLKLSDSIEIQIEKALSNKLTCVDLKRLGESKPIVDAIPRYIEFCKNTFPKTLSLKGFKIVIDCANGAGFYVAPSILRELGADVIPIFDQPDGININEACGAMHPQALQKAVIKHQADIGIALDGDADRLILVDHLGEVLDGDEILAILIKDYSQRFPHQTLGVVGTVMSNLGLEELLKELGIAFLRTPVGDRYILESLLKNYWPFGGETSGHVICFNHTRTGDAIITSLQVLAAMLFANKPLSELKAILNKYPQVILNVPFSINQNKLEDNKKLQQLLSDIKSKNQHKHRLVLRPSGTEPLIRIMLEGENIQQIKSIAQQIATCIQQ